MFSSYAWFIFVAKVSTGVSAHISGWSVGFKVDDEEVDEIAIDIEQIYPGMQNYEKIITVENKGEVTAEITYEIKKMVVLGHTYEVSGTVTPDDLKDMLENDFPFSLTFSFNGTDDNSIAAHETKDVKLTVEWPFNGDDEVDTEWGENAYEYYKVHGAGSISVHIELDIKVDQQYTN